MSEYGDARSIAQVLIGSRLDNLTTDAINKCVTEAFRHFPHLPVDQRDKLVRELEVSYQTVIGKERELVGDDEGWKYWLPERRGRLSWEYWDRYREYMRRGGINEDVKESLEDSTDRVLGLLGDPARTGSWDRRGLVVGLVQSGKTSHYIGLINKAVDTGYKVIVILTGFTESLRVQTQIRAEEGFLGHSLESLNGEMRSRPCGVGLIAPGKQPDTVTTRNNDFRKSIADNFAIQVGGKEILFVIKKNVAVLRNLLNWIENFGNATDSNGRGFVKDVPVLVIDDESDVGSIDTRKGNIVDHDPDPEHEPSRINELIRQLLSLFDQCSYVGYTATPFANVLTHDGGWTEKLGEDLFPRSFIVSLPTPSDHVGPATIFGRDMESGHEEGLPIVRHIPAAESQGQNAWIPPVHKKTCTPLSRERNEVPPSLRQALLTFILACCARNLRGDGNKHNSMLVHVTRFNNVQEIVSFQLKKELKGIIDRLRSKTAMGDLLDELRNLWHDDFLPTTEQIAERPEAIFKNPRHTWEEIETCLLVTVASIEVRTINGLAAEVLDYETHKDGLNVIAIGGDKLSRGLTLEGLSVSYFLRCSRMYDTLMQMGRWFGYRPGYLDLCRLFTTTELCGWFEHIANATEELRNEFDLMSNSGGSPKDFGLRVKSHSQLMVTSQVKMRHGLTIAITFQGDIVETIGFNRDSPTVESNWRAAEKLVETLQSGKGVKTQAKRENCVKWIHVPSDIVIAFLDMYSEHSSASKVRTRQLSEYIATEARNDRLTEWTVLVSVGSGDSRQLHDVHVNLVERGWHLTGAGDKARQKEKEELIGRNQYRIRRLVNPPDEHEDLDVEAFGSALRKTVEYWKTDPTGREKPRVPAGRFLRMERSCEKGLLILYPLDPGVDKSETAQWPVSAFAISFPAVDDSLASKVIYTVNNVYQKGEMA